MTDQKKLPGQAGEAAALSLSLIWLSEKVIQIGLDAPYSVTVMTQSGAGVNVWINKRLESGKFALVVQYLHLERSEALLQQAIEDVEAILQGTYKEVDPIGQTIGSNAGF
ncbi:hypothetical protein [Paenibacillus daejeonensis]|uniref:hypothetical protein n=1 Tax=Paenibacillus daejeonensis TaxID=135193 RepID=UPI0003707B65|nr:hypothetical protein [Paenibacillus daejeonensis]